MRNGTAGPAGRGPGSSCLAKAARGARTRPRALGEGEVSGACRRAGARAGAGRGAGGASPPSDRPLPALRSTDQGRTTPPMDRGTRVGPTIPPHDPVRRTGRRLTPRTRQVPVSDWRAFRHRLFQREGEGLLTEDRPVETLEGNPTPPESATLEQLESTRFSSKWAHRIHEPETGSLLLAHESMGSGFFRATAVLLLSHNREGTTGVIVNHFVDENVANMVPGVSNQWPVFLGGPVETRRCLVALSDSKVEGAEEVLPGLWWAPIEQLQGVAKRDIRVYMGYSGWGPGQLADELAGGCWSVVAASPELVEEKMADARADKAGYGEASEKVWKALHAHAAIPLSAHPFE